MKININILDSANKGEINKFLILLLFIFVLSVLIVSAVPREWISIQQISKDDNGLIPIDSNGDGIIDSYENNVHNSIVSNFSSYTQYISGKQIYLTTEGSFYILCINETQTQYQGYCAWFGLI